MKKNIQRIDWNRVVNDVLDGRQLIAVARDVGVAYSTLNQWRNAGVEPSYANGERMLSYWVECTGRDLANVPRISL